VFNSKNLHKNDHEVYQGSIISPLIANFTLDGLETTAFKSVIKSVTINDSDKNKKILDLHFSLIRYADNFVIILNHPRNLKLVKENVKDFLKIRGLHINIKKSKDIFFSSKKLEKNDSSSKFDFMGFTFMYQPTTRISRIVSRHDMTGSKKVIIHPSKKKCY